MPVGLTEWRVRIGRFIQNPPDINKQEMIQRFLERWKVKKETSKTAACQQQTTCQASTQTTCQQGTPNCTPETNPVPTCQSSTQITCQQGTPKCTPETKPVPACQPSTQTSCQQGTPSCIPETNPVPHSTSTRPAVWCITQVLFMLLTLIKTCFQGFRKPSMTLICGQHDSLAETSLLSKTKVFAPTSYFGRGLHFCNHLTPCVGFCVLYLSLILLIRAGDVETNPGPESTVSEMEFLKLSQAVPLSSYTAVGISLQIPFAQTQAILAQYLNNYTNALQDIFMKWNIKQLPDTNVREVLAAKLQEIDLGGLSNKLRNGSLIPNRPGAPSRQQTQPLPAQSQSKLLSPELIERCAKEFKSKYRSTLCKIRCNPFDPFSCVQFEDIYTNLFLQEEYRRCKRHLDYNDILDLKVNGEFPNRIMVQGEAGVGKTTLCAKIAWDWVQEKYFSHFTWVLIVPLRDSKKYTLGEIAKSYLAKNNPTTVSQITEFIRTNQDRVFIAFDGLDEFSGKVTKQDRDGSQTESYQSQSLDQAQASNVRSQPRFETTEACSSHSQKDGISFTDILSSDELADCPVIVTTRPWRAIEIRSDDKLSKLYTFIHVEGFRKENLSVYIHKYFPDGDDRANKLIQFTDENDVISENMAHYPIYVAMLCLMWKELCEQQLKKIKSLRTFSEIFQVMVIFLKENAFQKTITQVGWPEIHHLLEPVAKLAFTGLLTNTLVFSIGDFQICPESLETACRIGILSLDYGTSVMDVHDKKEHLPVFFPHKLFQEYMAGIYLASLYESDRLEFNRLIEQVVVPRKEEFRYLLYFTVSRNKPIANHVIACMLQGNSMDISLLYIHGNREIDFIVDVALESLDSDVAALVRDSVSVQKLTIDEETGAHTVAGYAFTQPHVVNLHVKRECGPTMSVDVAEMVCFIPSLNEANLWKASFHSDFFTILAMQGNQSKIKTLALYDVTCPTPASSHDLGVALCSMPHLTHLTLRDMNLNKEFYSLLKSNSSSIQVQTLLLTGFTCPSPSSSHDLGVALCSMPHLTHLTLRDMNLNEEFYSLLRSNSSSIQVQTLKLEYVTCPTPSSSHDLGVALCSMSHLTDLTLIGMDLNEEFCSSLKSNSSASKVQTLMLWNVTCPTPSSSDDLAVALCSMPHLTHLKLQGKVLHEEICSSLRSNALSLQGCFPQISNGNFRYNGLPVNNLNSFLRLLPTGRAVISNPPLTAPPVLGHDQPTLSGLDQSATQHHPSVHERASSRSMPWSSHSTSALPYHLSMIPSPNLRSRVDSSMVPSPNPQSSGPRQVSEYYDHSTPIGHHLPALSQQLGEGIVGTTSVPIEIYFQNTLSLSQYSQSTNPQSGVVSIHEPIVNLNLRTLSVSYYARSPNP